MPWFALHDMHEQDLRAFYRFVRYLGPAGGPGARVRAARADAERAVRAISGGPQMSAA